MVNQSDQSFCVINSLYLEYVQIPTMPFQITWNQVRQSVMFYSREHKCVLFNHHRIGTVQRQISCRRHLVRRGIRPVRIGPVSQVMNHGNFGGKQTINLLFHLSNTRSEQKVYNCLPPKSQHEITWLTGPIVDGIFGFNSVPVHILWV